MRVAIIHDWLTGMRGGEKCLEVFCELFPKADVYTLVYLPERVSPIIRSMKVHASWFGHLPGVTRYYRYGLPLFPTLIEQFEVRDYDLIISSSHCVAKGVFPDGALHISYVHSPMRYVWDMYPAYFDSTTSWPVRLGMSWCRGYLQRWDVRSAERVHAFVANSKYIAQKIQNIYRRDAAVIYPPVDVEKFHISSFTLPFYLIVSALVPYKRVELAIRAFDRLGLQLKIAGEGPLKSSLEKIAGPHVEFLGRVDDANLAELYATCQALIFPGEEDFGIVPLEAQASGRPVIAYGKGGATETVNGIDDWDGDTDPTLSPTGIFFREPTKASLIAAVERFQKVSHAFEPEALRRQAERFARPVFKRRVKNFIDQKMRERSMKANAQTA
jgi:glycosyltransferase involved in cell wall biosynthesis